jgi:hypothetical protein
MPDLHTVDSSSWSYILCHQSFMYQKWIVHTVTILFMVKYINVPKCNLADIMHQISNMVCV